jgi:hypothetical protein
MSPPLLTNIVGHGTFPSMQTGDHEKSMLVIFVTNDTNIATIWVFVRLRY